MKQLFMIILSLSISGTLVGLLILAMHPLTEKYFSKKWNYYIWLLVVVRLLVPFHFEMNFFAKIPEKLPASSTNFASTNTAVNTVASTTTTPKYSADTNVLDQRQSPNPVPATMQNLLTTIAYIWFLGIIATLSTTLLRYRHSLKVMKKNCIRITTGPIIDLENFLCAKLCVQKQPALYESAAVFVPMTLGLWNPVIFLPKGFSNEKDLTQLQLILHHELTHVARKDLFYKWVCQLLLCIHWFNPFLYQINRLINSDCELSCDEQILAQLTESGKLFYGNVLLDTAERTIEYRKTALSTTLLEDKKDLKKRLNHIRHYKKAPRFRLLFSTCTLGIALLFTACSTVWVSSDTTSSSSTKDTNFEKDSLFPNIFTSKIASANFINSFSSANKTSDAWDVYDDGSLLAGEDIQENWAAYNYSSDGSKIKSSGFLLYGSDTFLIAYADKDINVKITSSFALSEGKFKIIYIAPDNCIYTINQTGTETAQTISMKKGRNVLKMVGQGAKLTDLAIDYSNLKESSFKKIFYSEQEEYITQVKDGTMPLESYNKTKIIDTLFYLNAKDASTVFHALLDIKTDFTTEELCDFFIYSDSTLSGQYLIEALHNGNIAPLNANDLTELCPYLQGECLAELLQYLPQEEYGDAFLEVLPYLSDAQIEDCLSKFIENGGVITFSMYDKLSPYLSKKEILQKLDLQIPQIPQVPKIPD